MLLIDLEEVCNRVNLNLIPFSVISSNCFFNFAWFMLDQSLMKRLKKGLPHLLEHTPGYSLHDHQQDLVLPAGWSEQLDSDLDSESF